MYLATNYKIRLLTVQPHVSSDTSLLQPSERFYQFGLYGLYHLWAAMGGSLKMNDQVYHFKTLKNYFSNVTGALYLDWLHTNYIILLYFGLSD